MHTIKSFIIGAVCMALACSIAFNFYQAGQLKSCVVMPSTIAMPEGKLK